MTVILACYWLYTNWMSAASSYWLHKTWRFTDRIHKNRATPSLHWTETLIFIRPPRFLLSEPMIILPTINYFQDQWMTYSTHNFLPNRTHLNWWQKPRKWNYQIWMTPSSTFCDFYRSSSCSKQRTFIIIKTRGQESGTWSLARCQQGQWEWKSICVLKSNIHVSFDLIGRKLA